jgi:magnesium transporter
MVPLKELVDEDRRRVSVLDDQEEVARMFGKYNLVAALWSIPATDWSASSPSTTSSTSSRKRRTKDLKALGGVTSDEELSDSVWTISARPLQLAAGQSGDRLPSSSVLGLFEGQLRRWWRLRCWRRSWRARAQPIPSTTMTVAVVALATASSAPATPGVW